MRHIVEACLDSYKVVHYSPQNETLSVYRLPGKHTVVPSSTTPIKIGPVRALSIHPRLDIAAAVIETPSAAKMSSTIPTGPSGTTTTSTSSRNGADIIQSGSSNFTNVTISLVSFEKSEVKSTSMVLDLENPVNAPAVPYSLRFSSDGHHLAIYTRAYTAQKGTNHQISIFDATDNYKFVSAIKIDYYVEDVQWNHNSEEPYLLCACTDGQLRVIKMSTETMQLSLAKTYNISSSPLSSIHYPFHGRRGIEPRIAIGTRDGNTFLLDPTSMMVTHSQIMDKDLPILGLTVCKHSTYILTYASHTNEPAYIFRMKSELAYATDKKSSSGTRPKIDEKFESILKDEDVLADSLIEVSNFETFSTNDGASQSLISGSPPVCMKGGVVAYLNKDGSNLQFQKLSALTSIAKLETLTSDQSANKRRLSSTPASAESSAQKSKRRPSESQFSSGKRSLDLFEDAYDHRGERDIKRQQKYEYRSGNRDGDRDRDIDRTDRRDPQKGRSRDDRDARDRRDGRRDDRGAARGSNRRDRFQGRR